MIAVSHPGRIGDALYALPATRKLCEDHHCKADFYTSDWCLPLKKLLEYQSCINRVIVPPDYVIREHSIGIQPWDMPIPPNYDLVVQMGYREYPTEFLSDWICRSARIEPKPLKLEFPYASPDMPEVTYVVACSRTVNEASHYFHETPKCFHELASRVRLVITGLQPLREPIPDAIDLCGLDLLEQASLLNTAKGFIGQGSAVHTIATFMPHLKRAVMTLPFTDMRHLYHSPNDRFFPCPKLDVNKVLEWIL